MAAAAERGGERGGVELGDPAAHDAEHAGCHLDEHGERLRVGEVDELRRQVRDAEVDRLVGRRREQQLVAGDGQRLGRLEEQTEQLALFVDQRRLEIRRDQILIRAAPHAPRERLRVARRRARIRQRAGVLVNAEREDGCLERRRLELALREHADECRRQRSVVAEHRALRRDPVGRLAAVMVEDDGLHGEVARNGLEVSEPAGVRRVDGDQPADRVDLQPRRLDDRAELVRVQAVEVADVPVQRAGERDHRVRIEPTRGQHRREGVEVRVAVRGDDFFGAHAHSVPVSLGKSAEPGSARREPKQPPGGGSQGEPSGSP